MMKSFSDQLFDAAKSINKVYEAGAAGSVEQIKGLLETIEKLQAAVKTLQTENHLLTEANEELIERCITFDSHLDKAHAVIHDLNEVKKEE